MPVNIQPRKVIRQPSFSPVTVLCILMRSCGTLGVTNPSEITGTVSIFLLVSDDGGCCTKRQRKIAEMSGADGPANEQVK